MAESGKLLRKQVASEVRKTRLILLTIFFLTALYLGVTFLLGDLGFIRYIELRKTKTQLEHQITDISKDNDKLRKEIKLLKEDPFYSEKHAREKYGMSKPDEYIFQYER
jgi:cell division protein FtsB